MLEAVEGVVINAVQWLRLAIEATAALVIAVGAIMAIYGFGRALALHRPENYVDVRLTLARYLALAIEFELAADILSTAIAPSWEQIGKLGAIVVIRTGLNYFLMREMNVERVGRPTAAEAPLPVDN
jgi:uncharacterized membrane protein